MILQLVCHHFSPVFILLEMYQINVILALN